MESQSSPGANFLFKHLSILANNRAELQDSVVVPPLPVLSLCSISSCGFTDPFKYFRVGTWSIGHILREYILNNTFWGGLGAFTKLRKSTVSFVTSAFSPRGTSRLPLNGFPRNLRIFWKYVEKIQVWFKSDKNNGCFTFRSMCTSDNFPLSSS